MNIFSNGIKAICEKLKKFVNRSSTSAEEKLTERVQQILKEKPCPNLHEVLQNLSHTVTPESDAYKRVRHLAKYARKRRVRKKNQRRLERLQ